MKYLKVLLLMTVLLGQFEEAYALFNARFRAPWKRTGRYDEPNAVKRHPYTVFHRANESDAALAEQIEAIRQKVLLGSGNDFYEIYEDAYQSGMLATASDQSMKISDAAKSAKNAAFVYLCGFSPDGNSLTPGELEGFKDRAIKYLSRMNTGFSRSTEDRVTQVQWRCKNLIMYLEAYDLLRAVEQRDNIDLGLGDIRDRLIATVADLYKMTSHAADQFKTLKRGDNHSLMAASALGLAAIVLNDAQAGWYNFKNNQNAGPTWLIISSIELSGITSPKEVGYMDMQKGHTISFMALK